jgi:biopolymer transport protein ExbB/TolQ
VTWFNALQYALAAGAAVLIARRMRTLLFEASLDFAPFLSALEAAVAGGQRGLAQRIAQACLPAWPARLAAAGLAESETDRARRAVEDAQLDLETTAWRGLSAIVACARMATPLGFIGVILEIGRAFGSGTGLQGLQRGLVASIALERALFTFAVGASTLAACFVAATILQRRARTLRDQLRRTAAVVAQTAGE